MPELFPFWIKIATLGRIQERRTRIGTYLTILPFPFLYQADPQLQLFQANGFRFLSDNKNPRDVAKFFPSLVSQLIKKDFEPAMPIGTAGSRKIFKNYDYLLWMFNEILLRWGFPSSVSSADMNVWDKNQCPRINRKNLYALFLCSWSNVITRTVAEKFLMVGWNKISRWMRVQRASRARVKNFVFVWRYCRHLWHFIENWRIWLKPPIGAASAKNWILFLPCKKLYFSLTWWFFSSRESGTCLQCPLATLLGFP